MDELTSRAYAAYFRSEGQHADQPNASMSGDLYHDGKHYVVLRGGRGPGMPVLAVYRVRTSGALKRLKRWPAEIEEI